MNRDVDKNFEGEITGTIQRLPVRKNTDQEAYFPYSFSAFLHC